MRHALVALGLLLSVAGSAHGEGDVVEMKNGDRISGTIVKMQDEKLVLTTPYVKEVAVDWKEVASVRTDRPHLVRLGSGEFVTVRFAPRPDGVYLESKDLEGTHPVALDQIVTIDIPPGAQWSGTMAVLLNGTHGNTENAALGGGAEVIRETDADRFRVGVRSAYESQSNKMTVQNTLGWANYDYFFGEHWMARGFGRLEHDRFKDLVLRTTVGGGPGYRFIHTKKLYLATYVGLAYVDENFRVAEDRSFVSAALGDEFRWKISDTQSFYQTLDIYPSLEDTSDVITDATVGFRQGLGKHLFLDVGLVDEYDTKPAPGRVKNDLKYLGQLGYQF